MFKIEIKFDQGDDHILDYKMLHFIILEFFVSISIILQKIETAIFAILSLFFIEDQIGTQQFKIRICVVLQLSIGLVLFGHYTPKQLKAKLILRSQRCMRELQPGYSTRTVSHFLFSWLAFFNTNFHCENTLINSQNAYKLCKLSHNYLDRQHICCYSAGQLFSFFSPFSRRSPYRD